MIQKLQNSVLTDYSVAYAIQTQVANAINQCELITSAGYIALPENQRDIDFQIQNSLKKQGMAIVVLTPKLKYTGQDQDGNVYFDFPELVIQCTEYVNINRAGNKEKFATALDIATFLQTWLASLSEPVITFGQLCPDEVEQGEDNGLLVCTSKFKTFAGQKKPDNEWFAERKKFGLKIDNLLPDVVDGEFSYPETPKSDFVVPGLQIIKFFELQSRFFRNQNIENVEFPDLETVQQQGLEHFGRESNIKSFDAPNLNTISPSAFNQAFLSSEISNFNTPSLSAIPANGLYNAFSDSKLQNLNLSGVKEISSNGLAYAARRTDLGHVNLENLSSAQASAMLNTFERSNIEKLSMPNLSSVTANSACYNMCLNSKIKEISIPNLTACTAERCFDSAFRGCSQLTSIDGIFDKLEIAAYSSFTNCFRECPNLSGEFRLTTLKNITGNYAFAGVFLTAQRTPTKISAVYLDLKDCPIVRQGAFATLFTIQGSGNPNPVRKVALKNIPSNTQTLAFDCLGQNANVDEVEITFNENNLTSTVKTPNTIFSSSPTGTYAFMRGANNLNSRIYLDYRNSTFAYTSTINTAGLGIFYNFRNENPTVLFPEEWYCHGSSAADYHGLIYPYLFCGYGTGSTAHCTYTNLNVQNMKKIDHQWQTVLSPVAYMCMYGAITNFSMPDLEEVIMTNGLSDAEKQYFGIINHTFDNSTAIKTISFPKLRTLEGRIFHRANEFHANVRNLVVDLPKLETYIGDDYCIYSGPGYVDRINLHSLQLINNPIINITSNVGNNTQIYLNSDFLIINANIISNTTNKPITFYFSENNRAYIESHTLYPTNFGGGTNCTIEFI